MENITNNKMAAVGNKDTVQIFKSVGMDVYFETDADGLRDILRALVAREYAIVLIPEQDAEKVSDYLNIRSTHPYPIFLTVPDGVSNSGYSVEQAKRKMEKAMGTVGGFK